MEQNITRLSHLRQLAVESQQFSAEVAQAAAEALEEMDGAKVDKTGLGKANGVATLDKSGKLPESQLPEIRQLPDVTASDAGKFLRVTDAGAWAAQTIPYAEEASF